MSFVGGERTLIITLLPGGAYDPDDRTDQRCAATVTLTRWPGAVNCDDCTAESSSEYEWKDDRVAGILTCREHPAADLA
jgi:hypothetical protein